MKKIRILIIDSDEISRIYFRDIFWIHGRNNQYEVLIASNLEEADKIILNKDTCPDTVLLDITMSKKSHISAFDITDCVSFVSKIKNNKELPAMKIIIYSGHKIDSLKDNFEKVGIDGFLTKGENTPKEIISYIDKVHGIGGNN